MKLLIQQFVNGLLFELMLVPLVRSTCCIVFSVKWEKYLLEIKLGF